MPQATSTFSIARCGSACDLAKVFPFLGREAGDFVGLLFEQLLELEEILDAILRRGSAPLGEGGAHVVPACQSHSRQHFRGSRVENVDRL